MKEMLCKYKSQLILTLILIILAISTYFVYQINRDSTMYYVSVVLVEKEGIEHELKIRNDDRATIYRVGDSETILSRVPRVGKDRLDLPDLSKVQAENTLNGRIPINELTWELTFSDSFKYVNYLIETEMYEIKMYASTPQFIELFLLKDNNYKRLIIFRDTLMMSDMFEGVELPDIETYFENYIKIEENLKGE